MSSEHSAVGLAVEQPQLSLDLADAVESVVGQESLNESLRPAEADGPRGGRLTGLTLRNFKGFEEVHVELADFNVLVGSNNSGKSTILQAIKLGHLLLLQHFPESEGGRAQVGRTLPAAVLPVAEPRDLWFEKRWRRGNAPVFCEIHLHFDGGLKFAFGLRLLYGAVNSRLLDSPPLLDPEDLDRVRAMSPVLVPSSVGIVSHEEKRNAARLTNLIQTGRQNEAVRNMLHELQTNNRDGFDEIAELVKQHFGVDLRDVRFDPAADQFIDARYQQGIADLDLFSAGAGLVQVVQLLAFTLWGSHGIVLLDEPDAHLHSSMQLIVVDMLEHLSRQYEFQVLISTHSKEIINFVAPSLLIPVTRSASLQPLQPQASALAVLQELGHVDNVDLYSLFTSRRCIFVEGPSDAALLQRAAARVKSTVFEGDSRVVVVRTGGVDNFAPATAVRVFAELAGIQIAQLTVRDRDGLPDDKRQVLCDREPSLRVHSLDCIESYLVQPGALAKAVTSAFGQTIGEDEVRAIALAACDELKDETADRIANALDRWYAREERRHLSAGELNSEARSVRDNAWGDLAERLKYVPGKRVLAKCRDELQRRFHVSLSDQAIIDHLDVGAEMAELAKLIEECESL
jgi:predicted ATPase